MNIFLDTSALAKRYVKEPGSKEVDDLFFSFAREVFVSTLSFVEFAAAIGRKLRNKEMAKRSAQRALRELETDWYNLFTRVPLSDTLAESAASLAVQYSLKGADAVHLATAVEVHADLFVAADNRLITVAEKVGIKSYNPEEGPFQYDV